MSHPKEGRRFRLLKPMFQMGGIGPARRFPAGTEFTLVTHTVDHMDWFCSIIDVAGQTYRVGWAVSDDTHSEEIADG